jgi:dynein light intermediate chain 1
VDPDDNDDAEVDKADDLSPTVGVWTLNDATWPRVKFGGGGGGGDGGLRHGDLLSLVLQRAPLQHTIAVIALDLSAPWDVLPAAQAWLAALSAAMAPVLAALPLGEQDALRRAVRDHVASYGSSSSSSSSGGGGAAAGASEAAAMADPAGRSSSAGEGEDGSGAAALAAVEGGGAASMSENLGLPVVLLCTKSDVLAGPSSGAAASALPGQQEQEQEQQGDERLDPHVVATRHDFLQLQLRRLALRYGAALVYTSARDGTNCAELHRYLLHRLYPEGGTVAVTPPPPQAVERAAVLVPSGWDSPELIGDAPGGWSFDTPFEKVWPRPKGAFSAAAAAAAAAAEEEEEEDAPQATAKRPELPLDVPRVDEQGWLAEMRQLQEKEAGASGAAAGGGSSTEPRSASQLISGVFGSKESGAAAAAPAATGAAGDVASVAAGGSSSGLARKASRAADVNQKDLQNFFSNLLTRPNNRKASSATLEQDKLARLKAEKALSSLKK